MPATLTLQRLQQALSRCAILLVLSLGHFTAGRFLDNLQLGFLQIQDIEIRGFANILYRIYQGVMHDMPLLRPVMVALVLLTLVRQIRGHPTAWFNDFLGVFLMLRCASQFLFLNLLLLAPMRAGGLLLLMQLVLFLPVITIAFGWLYWRLDSGARRRGFRHIDFNASSEQQIDRFDYFYTASLTLVSFEPGGATPTTRLMKCLFLIHGLVMLDLVALTLSRAIALATSHG